MRIIRYAPAAAAALALAGLAACGGGSPAANPAASHPTPAVTQPATPSAPSPAKVAAANDREFSYGMAASTVTIPSLRGTVAGPVMVPYIHEQALFSQAQAAAGNPGPGQTVTTIPKGYQLCGDDGSGGTSCQSLTAFTHDAAGKITGLSVDGLPIAGRLAVGASNTGSQLAISHVASYRLTSINKVAVVFWVRNTSSHALTTGPAFLAMFNPSGGGQLSEDDNYSSLPSTLQPGESAAAYAIFDTTTVTGTFSLRSNDGYMAVLASTSLSKP